MSVDLAAELRRRKPEKRNQRLAVRDAGDRTLAAARPKRIRGLMPDTCVYIDAAADRLPAEVKALLEAAPPHHSSVSLGEIAVGLGNMQTQDRKSTRLNSSHQCASRLPASAV